VTLKEFIRFSYGLFMGTSTPYLKPTKRFLFPASVEINDENLSIVFGGSAVCAVLNAGSEVVVINTNQGDAGAKLRELVGGPVVSGTSAGESAKVESKADGEGGDQKITLLMSSLSQDFTAGLPEIAGLISHFLAAGNGGLGSNYFSKDVRESTRNLHLEQVSHEMILDIRGERLWLIPMPHQCATGSDLVIFLEHRSIMFLGALFYNHIQPVLRIGPHFDVGVWIESLEGLLERFKPKTVIPAEGDPGTIEDVQTFISYLRDLSDPKIEFRECRSKYNWPEIPSYTSLEENFDLIRGVKSHTTLG
jgi:hypothetical protein